ncbi:MAG TPA: TetR/AcrR family transcriptional regulator [Nitrospirota bacterium]|nr:TetR/AcrR family transcriptional regulator [Nitrospirota bacterium]
MGKKRKLKKAVIGRRPTPARPDLATRAAILAAARNVFARCGFEGASTREVAEVARVNNAMIYYHFKDKGELYRAVLADSFNAFDRIWEHEIFGSPATARAKIQRYLEEFIRFQHSNEELRRIISMEFAACSENCKWLADNFFTHGYDKLANILKEGMKNGELKKFDPAQAIPSLVGMVIHSFIMRPITEYITGKKPDLTAQRFGKFVTDMFFDGLSLGKGTKVLHPLRGSSR